MLIAVSRQQSVEDQLSPTAMMSLSTSSLQPLSSQSSTVSSPTSIDYHSPPEFNESQQQQGEYEFMGDNVMYVDFGLGDKLE